MRLERVVPFALCMTTMTDRDMDVNRAMKETSTKRPAERVYVHAHQVRLLQHEGDMVCGMDFDRPKLEEMPWEVCPQWRPHAQKPYISQSEPRLWRVSRQNCSAACVLQLRWCTPWGAVYPPAEPMCAADWAPVLLQ